VAKKTKPKTKTGRPTKYKPAYCQALIDYFDIEPWEERQIPHYKLQGKQRFVAWTDIKMLPVRMPTLRGFAKKVNVGISTIYDWLNEQHGSYQQAFSGAFTCAQAIRKDWLIDVGLSGSAPPASFKFVAVNVTDMRDKSETEHSGAVTFTQALSGATSGNDD
jgi:hypothetical protein